MLILPFEYLIKKLYYEIYKDDITDEEIINMIETNKAAFKNLFDSQFTLTAYEDNENYNKIKNFLIERYAKLKTLIQIISKLSKNFSELPDYFLDLILMQFGLNFTSDLTNDQKRVVLRNVVDFLTAKGTKKLVEDTIQTLSTLENVELHEYDLTVTPEGVVKLVDTKSNVPINLSLIEEMDPHWMITEDFIRLRQNNAQIGITNYLSGNYTTDDLNKINLYFPLRTPYFSLQPLKEDATTILAKINFIFMIMRNEIAGYFESLDPITNIGTIDRPIYVPLFKKNLSFTELWLLITVILIRLIEKNNVNMPDPNELECVIMYDESLDTSTSELINIFNKDIYAQFPQLKELALQFFLDNYENLYTVPYTLFKNFITTNWTDYYALEPEVADAIIYSLYLSVISIKRRIFFTSIMDKYETLIRLPDSYKEKYKSCPEDPTMGLLYYVYDKVFKGEINNPDPILRDLLNNPEYQLAVISKDAYTSDDEVLEKSKILKFVDEIFNKYTPNDPNSEYTTDDIIALLLYFMKIFTDYLYTIYSVRMSVKYFIQKNPIAQDVFITNTKFIRSIKPLIAREISTGVDAQYILSNPLQESIPTDDYDKRFVMERLYSAEYYDEYLRTYEQYKKYDENYEMNDYDRQQLLERLFDKTSYGENLFFRAIAITDGLMTLDGSTDPNFPGFIYEQFEKPPFGIEFVDDKYLVRLTPETVITNT